MQIFLSFQASISLRPLEVSPPRIPFVMFPNLISLQKKIPKIQNPLFWTSLSSVLVTVTPMLFVRCFE